MFVNDEYGREVVGIWYQTRSENLVLNSQGADKEVLCEKAPTRQIELLGHNVRGTINENKTQIGRTEGRGGRQTEGEFQGHQSARSQTGGHSWDAKTTGDVFFFHYHQRQLCFRICRVILFQLLFLLFHFLFINFFSSILLSILVLFPLYPYSVHPETFLTLHFHSFSYLIF